MAESDDMARITVRVPVEARDKVYKWAEDMGVRTGHFASMALMLGAEELRYRRRMMEGVTCGICERPVTYGAKVYVLPGGELLSFCEFHNNTEDAHYTVASIEHNFREHLEEVTLPR